jgi:cell division protein FtsQ
MPLNKQAKEWLLSLGLWGFALALSVYFRFDFSERLVHLPVVEIAGSPFVTQKELQQVFVRIGGDFRGLRARDFNLLDAQRNLAKNPYVATASVYLGLDRSLHAMVETRKPILRLQTKQPYYLDQSGHAFAVSPHYTERVLVATGNLPSMDKPKPQLIARLIASVKDLQRDDFLQAQIEQIYLDERENLYLYGKVGMHIIELGDLQKSKERLQKLKKLYLKGFSSTEWNAYDSIKLPFQNQVICTKKKNT